jgi:hypothetical protein
MYTKFWFENLKGGYSLKDLVLGGRVDNIRVDLKVIGWNVAVWMHVSG